MSTRFGCVVLFCLGMIVPLAAQTVRDATAAPTVQIPHLIRFNGSVNLETASFNGTPEVAHGSANTNDAAVPGTLNRGAITLVFALYAGQRGGEPVWQETQNVQLDSAGRYTVLLGSATSEGLPLDLFTSAKAQWLGIRQQGRPEQPRIMLLSVPMPSRPLTSRHSAANRRPLMLSISETSPRGSSGPNSGDSGSLNPISGSGTTNYVPLWTSSSTLSSSFIYQSMAGTVGIQETNPQAKLQLGNASPGLKGATTQATGTGILGTADVGIFTGFGVSGLSFSSTGRGVSGTATSTTGNNFGVVGKTASNGGDGAVSAVAGVNSATSGNAFGVAGSSVSSTGIGGNFRNSAATGTAVGMGGFTMSDNGIALQGVGIRAAVTVFFAQDVGVTGSTNQDGGVGLEATADDAVAVRGRNNSTTLNSPRDTSTMSRIEAKLPPF